MILEKWSFYTMSFEGFISNVWCVGTHTIWDSLRTEITAENVLLFAENKRGKKATRRKKTPILSQRDILHVSSCDGIPHYIYLCSFHTRILRPPLCSISHQHRIYTHYPADVARGNRHHTKTKSERIVCSNRIGSCWYITYKTKMLLRKRFLK